MAELHAAASDYRERLAAIEQAHAELRATRDAAMLKAWHAGIPATVIADEFGLSHQRVSGIIRR